MPQDLVMFALRSIFPIWSSRIALENWFWVVSFISVTVKIFFDGLIGISIPVAILLGRFLWLDTKDLHSIKVALKVDHDRIIESSILFAMGMLLISVCMHFLGERYWLITILSFIYGLIIYFPYCFVISRIDKKVQWNNYLTKGKSDLFFL